VQNTSHISFLILDEDPWEATELPKTLGSTVASQQIILINKTFISPLSSTHRHSSTSKNNSLFPLSFSRPHSSTSKKMQTRERKKMEREREREELMEERKKNR
jgi:hypothetical protein